MRQVEGLDALLYELRDVEAGGSPSFPFYCMLLATGADRAVSEAVRYHWQELDAMTGDACLVFFAAPGCPECWAPVESRDIWCPNCGSRQGPPLEDIYRLADEFNVRYAAMPCAVFFTEPHTSAERLVLVLTRFVPPFASSEEQVSADLEMWSDWLMGAFRTISDAVRVAVARSDTASDERLATLRDALIAGHQRRYEEAATRPSGTGERLQDAAASVEAIKTLGGAGLSISRVILHALGPG